MLNILFAAGGTGGHLFPALAIADEIRALRPDARILFVGTKTRIEANVVPRKGFEFRTIWIRGFRRGIHMSNLVFPLRVTVALAQSVFLVRAFRPHVVVGTGGYVSGPVLLAASLLGIPTVVHESNSYPGITTRLLASRATKVFIAFDGTKQWLSRHDNVELVGTPTRRELGQANRVDAAGFFHLRPDRKTVLVFGGSLGAASINKALATCLHELVEREIQIIWQTGRTEYERYRGHSRSASVWVGPFIDRTEYAYAASDLVVARAGATTLAEITRLGKPAILIPYPHAAEDHQRSNARVLVDAGAAVMIEDAEVQHELKDAIVRLLSSERVLQSMSERSRLLAKPDAGNEIAQKIIALTQ